MPEEEFIDPTSTKTTEKMSYSYNENVGEHSKTNIECENDICDTEDIIDEDDDVDDKDLNLSDLLSDSVEDASVEKAAISYFIGYIERKIDAKINCEQCRLQLIKPKESMNKTDWYIKNKSYKDDTALKIPSKIFFDVCSAQIKVFKSLFSDCFHKNHIKTFLKKKIVCATNNLFPEWFNVHDTCYEHRHRILDFLLLILIRKNSAWLLEKIHKQKNDEKFKKKLKRITC